MFIRDVKSVSAIVVAALALSASGCSAPPADQDVESDTATVHSGLRRATVGRIKVALVPSAVESPEYNALAVKGLQEAVVKLRVTGVVPETRSPSEYVGALSRAASDGYDLIISMGPSMATATLVAAERFPDTLFAIVDYAYPLGQTPPNVQGLIFDEAQAGYLAGYVSGMMSRSKVIAAFTDGSDAARRYARGFRAGARATGKMMRIQSVLVPAGAQTSACRTAVDAEIRRGADVLFPLGRECTESALEVAAQRGVWGVGAGTDQSRLGPHILTSAVKNVDVAVFDAIQGVANGAIEQSVGAMAPYGFHGGGVTVYGAQYRAIGLGRSSPTVPPRVLARIDVLKRRMTGGAIVIPEYP